MVGTQHWSMYNLWSIISAKNSALSWGAFPIKGAFPKKGSQQRVLLAKRAVKQRVLLVKRAVKTEGA